MSQFGRARGLIFAGAGAALLTADAVLAQQADVGELISGAPVFEATTAGSEQRAQAEQVAEAIIEAIESAGAEV